MINDPGKQPVKIETAPVRLSAGLQLSWRGRDELGPLPPGPAPYTFRAPPAHARRRVGAPLDVGVRVLNTFVTCTGAFTVLVDGDDHNKPVADAVRGILDGHIVIERAIAERGRYPAINILKPISRTMPRAADPEFLPVINRARQVMATYADMEELIRLGAYRGLQS